MRPRDLAQRRDRIDEASAGAITKEEVDTALGEFDGVWSSLSPKEQAKLVKRLEREFGAEQRA